MKFLSLIFVLAITHQALGQQIDMSKDYIACGSKDNDTYLVDLSDRTGLGLQKKAQAAPNGQQGTSAWSAGTFHGPVGGHGSTHSGAQMSSSFTFDFTSRGDDMIVGYSTLELSDNSVTVPTLILLIKDKAGDNTGIHTLYVDTNSGEVFSEAWMLLERMVDAGGNLVNPQSVMKNGVCESIGSKP